MAAYGRRKARADVANRVHYETIDRRLRIASDGTTCKHPRYFGGGELSLGLPLVRLLQIGDLHLPTAARTVRTVDQKFRTFSLVLRNVFSRQPITTLFNLIYRFFPAHLFLVFLLFFSFSYFFLLFFLSFSLFFFFFF